MEVGTNVVCSKTEVIEERKWHVLSQIKLYMCVALIKMSGCFIAYPHCE